MFSIYFFLIWVLGVVYCFDIANATPYLGKNEKMIVKALMVLLCITLPLTSFLLGHLGAAKYTTNLQEKWRKHNDT